VVTHFFAAYRRAPIPHTTRRATHSRDTYAAMRCAAQAYGFHSASHLARFHWRPLLASAPKARCYHTAAAAPPPATCLRLPARAHTLRATLRTLTFCCCRAFRVLYTPLNATARLSTTATCYGSTCHSAESEGGGEHYRCAYRPLKAV